jgi:hypothetical protein
VRERAKAIGSGYGDYVDDVVTRLKSSGAEKLRRRTQHAVEHSTGADGAE